MIKNFFFFTRISITNLINNFTKKEEGEVKLSQFTPLPEKKICGMEKTENVSNKYKFKSWKTEEDSLFSQTEENFFTCSSDVKLEEEKLQSVEKLKKEKKSVNFDTILQDHFFDYMVFEKDRSDLRSYYSKKNNQSSKMFSYIKALEYGRNPYKRDIRYEKRSVWDLLFYTPYMRGQEIEKRFFEARSSRLEVNPKRVAGNPHRIRMIRLRLKRMLVGDSNTLVSPKRRRRFDGDNYGYYFIQVVNTFSTLFSDTWFSKYKRDSEQHIPGIFSQQIDSDISEFSKWDDPIPMYDMVEKYRLMSVNLNRPTDELQMFSKLGEFLNRYSTPNCVPDSMIYSKEDIKNYYRFLDSDHFISNIVNTTPGMFWREKWLRDYIIKKNAMYIQKNVPVEDIRNEISFLYKNEFTLLEDLFLEEQDLSESFSEFITDEEEELRGDSIEFEIFWRKMEGYENEVTTMEVVFDLGRKNPWIIEKETEEELEEHGLPVFLFFTETIPNFEENLWIIQRGDMWWYLRFGVIGLILALQTAMQYKRPEKFRGPWRPWRKKPFFEEYYKEIFYAFQKKLALRTHRERANCHRLPIFVTFLGFFFLIYIFFIL